MASPLNNPSNDRQKWQAVADACEELFALNQYSLDPDYQGLFYNHMSPEIIFQRLYNTEFGHWFNWYNQPNGYLGWSYTCVTQEMVDSYEMEDGTMPDPTPYMDPSNPSDLYPWANRDPRFYATVVCDGQNFVNRPVEYWVNEDVRPVVLIPNTQALKTGTIQKVIIPSASSLPKTLPHRVQYAPRILGSIAAWLRYI